MNNSDMPAMPVTDSNGPFMQPAGPSVGLSKREHFAAMAMQGLMSAGIAGRHNRLEVLIPEAVRAADALLKALEEAE